VRGRAPPTVEYRTMPVDPATSEAVAEFAD
jgi:hypothetical protein